MRQAFATLAALVTVVFSMLGSSVGAQTAPRYLDAMQTELTTLGLDPVCEALGPIRARCTVQHLSGDARHEITVHANYSDESDTIYLYIPRIAVAPVESETTPGLLRRLMELNWQMLATKLEWNPSDGEVRISALLHTDSNFDRRAFRNVVRVLLARAQSVRPELRRLIAAEPLD